MRTDNHQVNIRVNEAEYAKIQASARIMGLSVPKYCKHLVMQSKLKEPKLADDEYHHIIVDLSRIGNTLIRLLGGSTRLKTNWLRRNGWLLKTSWKH